MWRFAEEQWDSVGYHIGRYYVRELPAYNGWIDLFLWGTGKDPQYMYGEKNIFADWGRNKIIIGCHFVMNTDCHIALNSTTTMYAQHFHIRKLMVD